MPEQPIPDHPAPDNPTPESTLTAKGQTTLPRQVRRALGLTPGDRLRYLMLDDGEVRLVRTRPAVELAGLLHRPGRPAVPLAEIEAATAAGAAGEA